MIEVYAFLTIFLAQILTMSVLFPAQLAKHSRAAQAASANDPRHAEAYPGVDHERALERFLAHLRMGSIALVAIGLGALGWLFVYMTRGDWSIKTVLPVLVGYFMLQSVPLMLAGGSTYKFYKSRLQPLLGGKRTASLARRRLFDVVSPSLVFTAVGTYVLFVAFALITHRDSQDAWVLMGVLTFVYATQAHMVYGVLYGKKPDLPETNEVRQQRIRFTAKLGMYMCILNSVFFGLIFVVDYFDLQRWVPMALSAFFVVVSLLISSGITRMLRRVTEQALEARPAT